MAFHKCPSSNGVEKNRLATDGPTSRAGGSAGGHNAYALDQSHSPRSSDMGKQLRGEVRCRDLYHAYPEAASEYASGQQRAEYRE